MEDSKEVLHFNHNSIAVHNGNEVIAIFILHDTFHVLRKIGRTDVNLPCTQDEEGAKKGISYYSIDF